MSQKERIWQIKPDGKLSLPHQLQDGRTLTWYKGEGEFGFTDYWIRLERSGPENDYPDFFMTFDNRSRQVGAIFFTGVEGNVSLGFDGQGNMISVQIKEPNQQLLMTCSLLTGGVAYRMIQADYYFADDENGYEIREIFGNNCQLGINVISRDKLLVKSESWPIQRWVIDDQAIKLKNLLVFSPQQWGDSASAELAAWTMKKIVSERVQPYASC